MLETFIKNKGMTKTIVHDSRDNLNNIYEMEWDADYDGKNANLSLDLYENGKQGHYKIKLDNDDLASLLNIPSIEGSLEKRLKKDFIRPQTPYYEPKIVELEDFPKMDIIHSEDLLHPLTVRKMTPESLFFLNKKSKRRTNSKRKSSRTKRRKTSRKSSRKSSRNNRITF